MSLPVKTDSPVPPREVKNYVVAGTTEEHRNIQRFLDATEDGPGFSQAEKEAAWETQVDGLLGLALLPQFVFNSSLVNLEGDEQVEVYIVKGPKAVLQGLSDVVEAYGGEVADVGIDATKAALQAFTCLAQSTIEGEKARTGYIDPFAEQDVAEPESVCASVEAVPAPKRRSPSKERYILRHKFGVRHSQLIGIGMPQTAATYLCDRIKKLQREGWAIEAAIGEAHLNWAEFNGWDGEADVLKVRIENRLTVPYFIAAGWSRDKARMVADVTHRFLLAGADVQTAVTQAVAYWDANTADNCAAVRRRIREDHDTFATELFVDALVVGDEFPLGTNNTELPSGAGWVAGVAVQLLREKKPGSDYRYRHEEALAQAWTEWSSCDRAHRLGVREAWHLEAIKSKPFGWCECSGCEDALTEEVAILAQKDEDSVFPPAPKVATKPRGVEMPPELAGILGFLLSNMGPNPWDLLAQAEGFLSEGLYRKSDNAPKWGVGIVPDGG